MNPARFTSPPAQVVTVLLLPAVFAALGGWELVRGRDTVAAYAEEQASAEAVAGRLRALAEKNPQATVAFEGTEMRYAAPLAATMLADQASELGTDGTVARVRLPFAALAAGAGILALLAGIVGLLVVAVAARRGMRSRAELVAAFGTVRRVLPFALGVQVSAVALALLGAAVFECGGLWFLDTVSAGEIKLVGLLLVGAGLAIWGAIGSVRQLRRAFGLFEPQPARLLGLVLDAAAAPGLFALLRELAQQGGAAAPDTVVAGAVSGFFVTSYPQVLPSDRVVEGRTLHVPLPQLALLGPAELRAVLSHELAHFSGDDTAFSMRFQPVFAALQHSVLAVAGRAGSLPIVDRTLRPAASLGGFVLDRFDRAVKHWSRLRELEADKAAVRSGGADAVATSLLRTAVAGEIMDLQLRTLADDPAHAPDDLVAQTVSIAREQGFVEPERYLAGRQPHPTDTHPPTARRIESAGVDADAGLLARAARPLDPAELAAAAALFADWPGLCRAVTAQLRALAEESAREDLQRMQEAAAAVDDSPVELREPRGRMLASAGTGLAVCLLLAAALLWLVWAEPSDPGDDTTAWLLGGAAVFAAGALLCVVALVRLGRSRAPFLLLEAGGLRSPGFEGLIPWDAVRDVRVVAGRSVTTVLSLTPEQALPARTGRIWRLRTRRRRHAVVLSGLTPAGMKASAYLALLHRYRSAAYARAELARRAPE